MLSIPAMPSGWRTKHAGTVEWRRSATGATIAPDSSLPAGTAAIIGMTIIGEAIVGGPTTGIRGTKVFRAVAATGAIIAIHEIIATISVEEHDDQTTLLMIRLPFQIAGHGPDYRTVIKIEA
jgi:hypothetical protein